MSILKYTAFFFIIVYSLALCSCGNNASASKNAEYTTPPSGNDSIAKILKDIHASEKSKKLDSIYKHKVKEEGFNGCVLVAQHGQIIYKNSFGFSNIKTKDSLKLNSAFQLASASKTLTSAAILLLKDQGKLKLTDSVQQFFPDFPYHNITIKLLLTHRSGLFNYLYSCEQFCQKPNLYNGGVFDNHGMMEIITTHKCDVYACPNKKFEYSNTNYALLACIVEKVSGMKFADFMEQNIFRPLGMNDTWIHDPKGDSEHKNKTTGHNAFGKMEDQTFADDVVGDKGVYSTVEDMYKWDQALYSDKLLKKETISEAFIGYSTEHKGKRNYGYGWRLIDDGKHPKIIYHNGWWHGYASLFFRRPADKTTIIVLSNKYNRSAYGIQEVLAILNNNSEAIEMDGQE